MSVSRRGGGTNEHVLIVFRNAIVKPYAFLHAKLPQINREGAIENFRKSLERRPVNKLNKIFVKNRGTLGIETQFAPEARNMSFGSHCKKPGFLASGDIEHHLVAGTDTFESDAPDGELESSKLLLEGFPGHSSIQRLGQGSIPSMHAIKDV